MPVPETVMAVWHWLLCPCAPVTVRMYVVVTVGFTCCESLVETGPTFVRFADVAFEEFHESVTDWPGYVLFELADMEQEGVPDVVPTYTVVWQFAE